MQCYNGGGDTGPFISRIPFISALISPIPFILALISRIPIFLPISHILLDVWNVKVFDTFCICIYTHICTDISQTFRDILKVFIVHISSRAQDSQCRIFTTFLTREKRAPSAAGVEGRYLVRLHARDHPRSAARDLVPAARAARLVGSVLSPALAPLVSSPTPE